MLLSHMKIVGFGVYEANDSYRILITVINVVVEKFSGFHQKATINVSIILGRFKLSYFLVRTKLWVDFDSSF